MEAEGAAVSVSIEVTPSPAPVAEVPVRPARPADGPLPHTGADAGSLVAIALALIVLGSIVVLLVRTNLERFTTHA